MGACKGHLLLTDMRVLCPSDACMEIPLPGLRAFERAMQAICIRASNILPDGAGAVERQCVQRIAKVHDQHLSFIALEAGLFSLGLPNSYLAINDPGANDTQIEVRACAAHRIAAHDCQSEPPARPSVEGCSKEQALAPEGACHALGIPQFI